MDALKLKDTIAFAINTAELLGKDEIGVSLTTEELKHIEGLLSKAVTANCGAVDVKDVFTRCIKCLEWMPKCGMNCYKCEYIINAEELVAAMKEALNNATTTGVEKRYESTDVSLQHPEH